MAKTRSAHDRLAAFFRHYPKALDTLTLAEIGERTGMSREWVRRLLPTVTKAPTDLRQHRRAFERCRREERLRAYLEKHPAALKTHARGGMSLKAIAAKLNIRPDDVGHDWRALGLPDRRSQRLTPEEAAHRKYQRNKAHHYELTKAWKRSHPACPRDSSRRQPQVPRESHPSGTMRRLRHGVPVDAGQGEWPAAVWLARRLLAALRDGGTRTRPTATGGCP